MSFRIFASGSGGFHYAKENNIDSDDFDTVKMLAAYQFTDPTAFGLGSSIVSYHAPSADMTDAASALALIEFTHNVRNAVDSLAMCSGACDGWISVSGRTTHLLWPDTVSFAQYNFNVNGNPGFDFLRVVAPQLKNADLNTFGVLYALGIVLGKFSNEIDPSSTPIINIQLSH